MNKFLLKSSSKKSLDLYLQFLKLIFDKLGLTYSFFYFPITKKRIALLKSPHVYKKFKEHFEIRNYKVIFSFSSFLNLTVLKYFFMNKPKSIFLKFKFSQKNYLSLEAQVLTSVIGSMDPSLLTGPLLFTGTAVVFLFLYSFSIFSSSNSLPLSPYFTTKGNEKKPLEESTSSSMKEERIQPEQKQELLKTPDVQSQGEQVLEESLVSVVESKVEQILEESVLSVVEMQTRSVDYLEKVRFLRDQVKSMLECFDRKDALLFDSENSQRFVDLLELVIPYFLPAIFSTTLVEFPPFLVSIDVTNEITELNSKLFKFFIYYQAYLKGIQLLHLHDQFLPGIDILFELARVYFPHYTSIQSPQAFLESYKPTFDFYYENTPRNQSGFKEIRSYWKHIYPGRPKTEFLCASVFALSCLMSHYLHTNLTTNLHLLEKIIKAIS